MVTPVLLIRQLSHGQISNSLRITQLGNGEAGTRTQAVWLQGRPLGLYAMLPVVTILNLCWPDLNESPS